MSTRARAGSTRRRPPPRARARPRGPRVSTDPRFSRRRKAVARSRNRRLIVRSSIVAVLLFSPWVAFVSPLLRVRSVEVAGSRHTEPDDVVAAADLNEQDNLLLLSTGEVTARVGDLPWVSSVEVDRKLPGTVRIQIEERQPAMVLSIGAARWIIDAHGRVLEAGATRSQLPILAGVQVGTVAPGVDLKTPEAVGAMRVWRSLPEPLARDVAAIFAPTVERITLALADGTQVRYGAPEDIAAKNEVLRALLARLAADGSLANYIDIRVPSRPAVSERAPVDPTEPVTSDAYEVPVSAEASPPAESLAD